MPWTPEPGLGFTTAPTAWLPFGDRSPSDTVDVQRRDPASFLSTHRRLLAARARTAHRRAAGAPTWLDLGEVTAYRTGALLVVANLTDRPHPFHPGPGNWRCEFDTDAPDPEVVPQALDPAQAVILNLDAG